jgi:hypothetical protein
MSVFSKFIKKVNVQSISTTLLLLSLALISVFSKKTSLTSKYAFFSQPITGTCVVRDDFVAQPITGTCVVRDDFVAQESCSSSLSNYSFATIDFHDIHILRRVTSRITQQFAPKTPETSLIQKSGDKFTSMVAARWHLQNILPNRGLFLIPRAQAPQATSQRVTIPTSRVEIIQSIGDIPPDAKLFQTEADLYDATYGWGLTFEFSYSKDPDSTKLKVKPSETQNYAFQTRNRIQKERYLPKGEGQDLQKESLSIDPFLPTHQLFREMSQIEQEICDPIKANQPILQIDSEDSNLDSENLVASGLANLIANAHNTSLLNNLLESPHYNKAASLIHHEIANQLNTAVDNNNISSVGNQDLEVYMNNPETLNQLSEYVKILETAENISEKDYKVSFTGEKNEKDLNTFCNNSVYSRAPALRSKIKRNLENQNNNPLSFTVALSSEDILSKVQAIEPENKVISTLTATILDMTEKQNLEKDLIEGLVGSTEQTLRPLTYESQIDGDHWLRKNLRAALKQRLLNTKASNDHARCVELPIPAHIAKETVNFAEPEDINYSQGLDTFLNTMEKRVHDKINNCSPSQLHNMPAEAYNKAYSISHEVKRKELNQRYPTLTSREKYMIYHAELAFLSDQENLDSLVENQLSPPVSLDDQFNGKVLRNTVVGQNIKKNMDLSADVARKVAGERGAFIKTLAEFCSPEGAKVLQNIKDRHESFVKLRFNEIKEFTHELSLADENKLLNPESLIKTLFEKHLQTGSKFSSVNEIPQDLVDDVLYKHAKFLGLTDVGSKLPSSLRLLTLEQQEKNLTNFGLENPVKFEYLETHNSALTKKATDKSLTGNSCALPEFETVEAQNLHDFLTKNEIKLPKSLADLLVKKYGIHNLNELQTKTIDKSLLNESGFGENKLNLLENFFSTLDNQQTELQSNLDIVATLEEQSLKPGPVDPIFRKAANKVFGAGSKYKIDITQKNVSNEDKAQAIIDCIETREREESERRKIVADMVSSIMQNVIKNNQ